MPHRRSALATTALALLLAASLRGQSTTWTNTSGDGDWFNAANWTDGVPDASTDATVATGVGIEGTASAGSLDYSFFYLTLDLGSQLHTSALVFANANPDIPFLTLDGAGTLLSSTGPMDLGSHAFITATVKNGATLSSGGDLTLGTGGSDSLTIQSGGQMLVTGAADIGRGASSSTLTVTGANSLLRADGGLFFSFESTGGNLTVSDGGRIQVGSDSDGTLALQTNGTIKIGDGAAPGIVSAAAIDIRAGAATIVFNHNSTDYDFTTDGTAAGTPVVLQSGSAIHVVFSGSSDSLTELAGDSSYYGTTTLDSGTLRLGHSNALGTSSLNYNGGSLAYTDGITVSNAIALGADGTFDLASGTATQAGAVSGAYAFTKTGAGTLTLTGANTYTGGTTVAGGALTVDGGKIDHSSADLVVGNAAGTTTAFTAQGGATINVKDTYLAQAANSTASGTFTGAGTTLSAGALEVGYAGTGDLAVANGASIEAASIRLGATAGSSGTLTLSGATSSLSSGSPIIVGDQGDGSLTITDGASVGSLQFALAQSASGTGTLTLSGAATSLNFGAGSYTLANPGTSILRLTDGHEFSAGTVTIGGASSGSSTIEVSGAGSSLTASNGISFISNNASAPPALLVSDGAVVSTNALTLQRGALAVTGAGSSFTSNASTTTFGYNGATAITVSAGASLDTSSGLNGIVFIRNNSSGASEFIVTGTGSVWRSGALAFGNSIGSHGASITVADGGRLETSGVIFVADNADNSLDIAGAGTTVSIGAVPSNFDFQGQLLISSGAHVANVTVRDGATLAASTNIDLEGATTLNFGTGGAAPVIDTPEITSSTGAVLAFNHNSASATLAADLTGTLGLRHLGPGGTHLTGNLTTSGTTVIAAGTLFIDNTSASATTVETGGTLAGIGTFSALATIEAGGTLAPGDSPGTLTFTNGLTLTDGGRIAFDLGSSSDLILVSGGTLTGPASPGGVRFDFTTGAGFAPGSYDLIDATGATLLDFDVTDFQTAGLAGYAFDFALDGSVLRVDVSLAAIPEPSTATILLGLGALLVASALRFRHSRAA